MAVSEAGCRAKPCPPRSPTSSQASCVSSQCPALGRLFPAVSLCPVTDQSRAAVGPLGGGGDGLLWAVPGAGRKGSGAARPRVCPEQASDPFFKARGRVYSRYLLSPEGPNPPPPSCCRRPPPPGPCAALPPPLAPGPALGWLRGVARPGRRGALMLVSPDECSFLQRVTLCASCPVPLAAPSPSAPPPRGATSLRSAALSRR